MTFNPGLILPHLKSGLEFLLNAQCLYLIRCLLSRRHLLLLPVRTSTSRPCVSCRRFLSYSSFIIFHSSQVVPFLTLRTFRCRIHRLLFSQKLGLRELFLFTTPAFWILCPPNSIHLGLSEQFQSCQLREVAGFCICSNKGNAPMQETWMMVGLTSFVSLSSGFNGFVLPVLSEHTYSLYFVQFSSCQHGK